MSSIIEKVCRVCYSGISILLDFAKQPRAFDYYTGNENVEKFKFQLGQCFSCGTIQLVDAIPSSTMIPKYNWVENKEPTDHLNIVVETLKKDFFKDQKVKILFISKYDEPIYERVVDYENVFACILDPKEDLGLELNYISQATLQNKYVFTVIKKILNKYGKFDIIISCRMLEHSHQPAEFIKNLSLLLKDKGKMVIEIPDSSKPLVQTDVAMLWEEHLSYLTPSTLNNFKSLK
ncbi:MAG: methyltransferase domain-containing protein [SAR202 cluster bacterium]|nr:methyltransferase domain-containing protein [SAR202 cluster bacterium]